MPAFVRNMQIALLCFFPVPICDARFDHSIWDNLLRDHVVLMQQGQSNRIDFPGLSFKMGQLNSYLAKISHVKRSEFLEWDRSEQLAFLINAYNAFSVESRLRISSAPALPKAYPLRNIRQKSVLISWIRNQWNIQSIHMMGELLSLRELDEDWIRRPGLYDEPRVHFALYRGFHEGPALFNRAYDGLQLDQQLEKATRAFLTNRLRNRLDTFTHTLKVSELFKWYQRDFERSWQGWPGLPQFFAQYRHHLADDSASEQMLADDNFQITFQEFNWSQQ